jgi:hypothetical protein
VLERSGEKINPSPLPGIELRFLSHQTDGLVTVLSELIRLGGY